MSEILYPSGYGTDELPIDELMDRHLPVAVTEPEFRRRMRTLVVARGGQLGFGDRLPRSRNNSVSAASSGNRSFHQLQKFGDGSTWCAAIDCVVRRPGLGHSSGAVPVGLVPVQGSVEAKRFGVHANIGVPGRRGFESWHAQPVELDGFWGWSARLRPRPKPGYPIPVVPDKAAGKPVVKPVVAKPVFDPRNGRYGTFPSRARKPRVRRGSQGDYVRYLQGVILHKAGGRIVVDGDFGPQTEARVRDMQRFFGAYVDGWVGSQSWKIVDMLAVR